MTIACPPSPKDYALDYIARGFPVLPLCWPNKDHGCGCGHNHEGRDIGKAPLTKHGLKDATRTQTGIKDYWARWPHANVGIAIPPGYFVLDVDIEHGGLNSLKPLQKKVGLLPDTLQITTGSGGLHLWYKTIVPVRNKVALAGFPGIDIRGEGGYVVAPPSLHKSGKRYAVSEDLPIVVAPEHLIELCTLRQAVSVSCSSANNPIPEGQRNQTLTSLAGSMRRRGMSETAIEAALQIENRERCQPPLSEIEVSKIAKSIANYSPEPPNGNKDSIYNCPDFSHPDTNHYKTITKNITNEASEKESITSKQIEEWVNGTSGWFSTDELDRDLGIKTPEDKNIRRVCLHRLLKEKQTIEQHPTQNKSFRLIDKAARRIDFKSGATRLPLALQFPFQIERLVNIYPKNIIIIAGTANAGKTAWLLNFIRLNMADYAIYYFSSEMGDTELALRLGKFEGIGLEDWNFTAEERSSNFADVIRPDCINIIDFLEIDHDFNEVAGQIRQIYDKLNSGIAIIAIQKNPDVDLGRGGTFSLEKARLYLSMDDGVTSITKAKNWVNPEFNPNRMKIKYKIVGGCKFIIERDWYKE
jgi:Bifunctional DNA primase/polymerase, N-terminal/Primase C terminal 1 (PriCT-1)